MGFWQQPGESCRDRRTPSPWAQAPREPAENLSLHSHAGERVSLSLDPHQHYY